MFIFVGGARPTWIKLFPIFKEMNNRNIPFKIIHTGQHYDYNMNEIFFKELELPKPNYFLEVGSDTQARQVAKMMILIEDILLEQRPTAVICFGDTNCVPATALAGVKLGIPTIHLEAGLRSFDKRMPEEHNRKVADAICDYLFVSEISGIKNLIKEGHTDKQFFLCGNTLADTLRLLNKKIELVYNTRYNYIQGNDDFYLVTAHRPENVNNISFIKQLIESLNELNKQVIFPVHPRTKKIIDRIFGEEFKFNTNIDFTKPLGYFDFINLMKICKLVITDSGGIQEESTILGVPCLTIRDNTERPSTVTSGTNFIHGTDFKNFKENIVFWSNFISSNNIKMRNDLISLWDGFSSIRIVDTIMEIFK